MPTVSVLMAVYNAEAWLKEALDSLLVAQTLRDVEVLAVDDASTDHSWDILKERASQDPRLRIFRQEENQGQAVARNRALSESRGEFVTMLDADDWLSPDALGRAVEVFRQHPRTDCVVFRLVYHWQDDGREEDYPTSCPSLMDGQEAFRLSLDWTLHGLYVVRRTLHLRYPYDDSLRLYSDDNTTHLHYLHSREVRACPGIYYYRRHAGGSTQSNTPRRFLHIWANLGLRQTLEAEGVASDVLRLYDLHRWHVYRSHLWLYFSLEKDFDTATCRCLRQDFRTVYRTFSRRMPFPLFLLDQRLRWLRRRL